MQSSQQAYAHQIRSGLGWVEGGKYLEVYVIMSDVVSVKRAL